MKIKKILYIILGCAGVGLGALGAVLPLLPEFPFLLLSIGFIMMGGVPAGRIVLACVWLFHIIYFTFGVKTKKQPVNC